MLRLERSAILQREIRQDDPEDLGISTVTKVLELIDAERLAEAKELVKYQWMEWKGLHDLYADWSWALYDYIADTYGEEELYKALRTAHAVHMEMTAQVLPLLGPVAYSHMLAEFMRAHRSGPTQLGDVKVTDEGNRIVIECDPCGSGGRMMRGDPVNGTPSRLGPPYNYKVVKGAHPWTWGKENVPRYCVHCAVGELHSVEKTGLLSMVIDSPNKPSDPCRLIIYEDPNKVPEQYYKRLGKSKPKK